MNLTEARDLALEEMSKHLDGSWSFGWTRRKTIYGLCSFRKKKIFLSSFLVPHTSKENVLDTIRHEIAHAIAGYQAGHGPKWKKVARALGCNAVASSKNLSRDAVEALAQTAKWGMIATTENNRIVKVYHRKPRESTFTDVKTYRLKGKPETKGTLKIVPLENGVPVV